MPLPPAPETRKPYDFNGIRNGETSILAIEDGGPKANLDLASRKFIKIPHKATIHGVVSRSNAVHRTTVVDSDSHVSLIPAVPIAKPHVAQNHNVSTALMNSR